MRTAIMLQVRLSSSRLPGKALLEIEGKTVIEHAMCALKQIPAEDYVLVTSHEDLDALRPFAQKCGFSAFGGSLDDVLDRYIEAAKEYGPDIIIRATGDNPLVAIEPASQVLKHFQNAYPRIDHCVMQGLAYGAGVEVFQTKALYKAGLETTAAYDHEHVTPYLYNNPQLFNLDSLDFSPAYSNRVTIDTQDDYENVKKIFSDIYDGKAIEYSQLCDYFKYYDQD